MGDGKGGDKKGGGQQGYSSPNSGQYEAVLSNALYNRMGMGSGNGGGSYGAQPSYSGGSTVRTTPPSPQPSGWKAGVGSNYASNIYGKGGTYPVQTGTGVGGNGNFSATSGNAYNIGNQNYNVNRAGSPLYGRQGVAAATEGYDFSPIDEAVSGFKNPFKFSSVYKSNYKPSNYDPYKFNFTGLPDQYYQKAYAAGSHDILNQGQGDLNQIQETIGVRRPGLLLQAAEGNRRQVGQNLAGLDTRLGLQRMQDEESMAKEQQINQAAENFRAAGFNSAEAQKMAQEQYQEYQSQAAKEQNQANEYFRNRAALAQTGAQKIGIQSGLTQAEREYQDKAIQYLLQLFGNTVGAQNSAASIANSHNDSGFLSSLLGLAGGIGGTAFGGPLGGAIGSGVGRVIGAA